MSQQPPIFVRDLHKSFGDHSVLDGVSFAIPEGHTLALLGRNGAGKTTTIRALMGLLEPDSGALGVAGFDPQRKPMEVRKRAGYLAEDQQMFGWMTVDQLIRFVAPFYETWDHVRAERYVAQFELSLHKKVKHLSKGQGVRLGLLLALAHQPKVLILDDPALALDPIMRMEFNRDLVSHLEHGDCTVLYSSHLLAEVEAVADSVAILDGGRILRHAPTEELRENVKRLVFPTEHLRAVIPRLQLLDLQVRDLEASVVVDQAESAMHALAEWDIDPQVIALSLDEIFAAFVTGRVDHATNAVPAS
jgi:ABC-2 type transport system ATP-binding protein